MQKARRFLPGEMLSGLRQDWAMPVRIALPWCIRRSFNAEKMAPILLL
jgi:hypothetical protein